jgi:DNA excision repair protein ERCC-3
VSPADVRALLEKQDVPFLTAETVANACNCSGQTARNKLRTLTNDGDLTRVDLGRGKPTLWFAADYEAAQSVADALTQHLDLGTVNADHVGAFAQEPYKVLPKAENEYYVVVPRFVPFHAGHLHEQDDAWQVFVVNKYISWIEDLPEEIRDQIDIRKEYESATVEDNILELTDEAERDRAWEDLGGREGGLHARKDDDKIQIQRGHEFDVIANLVEQGNLPFAAQEIPDDELRGEPEGVSLRSYQERAWERFREYGQIGVYWPPGTGKTFLALYAGERVSGSKLVVVPTSTLEQQWEDRIDEMCERPYEWDVRTYQYLTRGDNMDEYEPALTIFDECHRLPANTFSKLATLETDYRIGLSASPYREDDRTDYIFALTGVPVGVNWQELVELGAVEYPAVSVYLYRTDRQKREDTLELARQKPGKGVIFCDGLDAGQALADDLDVPFVSGETPKGKRMDLVRDNRVAVVSRVGDEGLSLDELDWTIEHGFHGGSRRQELQRTGRVMHGDDGAGTHIVQMTDDEAEKFSERLYSLEERGMDLRYERRA